MTPPLSAGRWVLAVLAVIFVSCSGPEPLPGGSIRSAGSAQRVVAVAPGVVESLYALGLGDRLVGVGDFVRWPPEATDLPRIGGLYNPRLETIAALEPDLAILVPSEEELARSLKRLGAEILFVPHETVADIERAFELIADRLGETERGRFAARELRSKLLPKDQSLAGTVLLSVARQSGSAAEIYAAGPNTFLGELLDRLGAENAVADLPGRYPRLAFEEALLRKPDVVVELQPEMHAAGAQSDDGPATTEPWRTDWQMAGANAPCVVVIAGDYVLLPGPRLPRLYDELEAGLRSCGVV